MLSSIPAGPSCRYRSTVKEKIMNRPALEGIRVIDLTQFEAGTVCTMSLAWMGAEVIKVERPKFGAGGRFSFEDPKHDCYGFLIMNANKKSVTLDVKTDKGKELLTELIKKGDVIVENMGPGVIERLGFGYEKVKEINPAMIFAQIKGFGNDSPYARYPAFAPIGHATGVAASITGEPDGPPMQPGINIGDSGPGYLAAMGIVAALYQRKTTGTGQRIEVTMQEAVIAFARSVWEQQLRTKAPAPRAGNGMPLENVAPAGMYRCKPFGPNDYVHIYISRHPGSSQWKNLCEVIGRTDLMEDPRMATPQSRYDHREELNTIINQWTEKKTKHEAMDILAKAGVPAGAVLDTMEITNDPYMKKRIISEIEHPFHGKVSIPGFPVMMSDTHVDVTCAPLLGADNDDIYKGLLGLKTEEITDLQKNGII